MPKTKYEKFEVREVDRKQISLADYNPRRIDEDNLKRLEKGLKGHGLVEPLVWNERTGNLVSGHRRISILDKLEKGTDYSLTVSVVNVSEADEKKLNVQLNNPSMQGEYDTDMLARMLTEDDLTFAEMGFSEFDAQMMFGDMEGMEHLFADSEDVAQAKDKIKGIKEDREAMREKYATEQNADYYFVVVCATAEEKAALMKQMHVPAWENYITTQRLRRIGAG